MVRLRVFFAIFVMALALYFHQGRSWNVDSRLLIVYALVEDHTLVADRWKGETGDYATVRGHVYSDKAPIASLVVVPFYWAWRVYEHHKPQAYVDKEAGAHFGDIFASAVPFTVFAWLVWKRVARAAKSASATVWVTMLAVFGTCLENYAGMYLGHMLAAAFFVGAYALAVDRRERFVLAGFLGSLAVLTEYTLLLTQVIMCVYLLLGPDRVRRLGAYVLGAVPGAAAMFVYNRLITGHFLDFPYSHVTDAFAPMKTAFGIRLPNLDAAWELMFGQFRGLAFYAPTLLLFIPLIAARFDASPRRRALVLAMSGIYVLFMSSYFKWDGGWCTGPRHLSPIIALVTYEGAGALAALRRTSAYVTFTLLAAWGMAVSVAASATDCIPAESFKQPAFDIYFPRIWKGDLQNHTALMEWGMKKSGYLTVGWVALFLVASLVLWWVYRAALARPSPLRA
jgi:hypothetical protein